MRTSKHRGLRAGRTAIGRLSSRNPKPTRYTNASDLQPKRSLCAEVARLPSCRAAHSGVALAVLCPVRHRGLAIRQSGSTPVSRSFEVVSPSYGNPKQTTAPAGMAGTHERPGLLWCATPPFNKAAVVRRCKTGFPVRGTGRFRAERRFFSALRSKMRPRDAGWVCRR